MAPVWTCVRGCSQTERRKPNMMWWNAALFCTNVWRWTKGGQKATLSEIILEFFRYVTNMWCLFNVHYVCATMGGRSVGRSSATAWTGA